MDMMVSDDASASDVSDKIKEILYAKATEKIDAVKPKVAAGLFADDEVEDEVETETGETEE